MRWHCRLHPSESQSPQEAQVKIIMMIDGDDIDNSDLPGPMMMMMTFIMICNDLGPMERGSSMAPKKTGASWGGCEHSSSWGRRQVNRKSLIVFILHRLYQQATI